MRDSLLKLLVLCFAVSSIACACPESDQSGAMSSAHAGHAMHQGAEDGSSESHHAQPDADCCAECDGNVEPAVQELRPTDKDPEPVAAVQQFPVAVDPANADSPGGRPPDRASQPAYSTPVSLRDRMLD